MLLEEEKKWLTALEKKMAEPAKTAGDAEEVSEDLDVRYVKVTSELMNESLFNNSNT